MTLTALEIERFKTSVALPEIGKKGQEKLKAAKILILGCGGLGSAAAIYLAAAGLGTLGLVDFDTVEWSNLPRQILYNPSNIGAKKVDCAKKKLIEYNPELIVNTHSVLLDVENIEKILSDYDLVIDAVDNFPTRFLVNDTCLKLGKPLVEAGVIGFQGQVLTIIPGAGNPCLRCLLGSVNKNLIETFPKSQEYGIFSILPGILGLLEATEAIKVLLNIGQPLSGSTTVNIGKVLSVDLLKLEFNIFEFRKNPNCLACSK